MIMIIIIIFIIIMIIIIITFIIIIIEALDAVLCLCHYMCNCLVGAYRGLGIVKRFLHQRLLGLMEVTTSTSQLEII